MKNKHYRNLHFNWHFCTSMMKHTARRILCFADDCRGYPISFDSEKQYKAALRSLAYEMLEVAEIRCQGNEDGDWNTREELEANLQAYHKRYNACMDKYRDLLPGMWI